MPERRYAESITIDRSPQAVYDLVADVTRMGEWSPICKACWWDEEPGGARVGAIFTGRNVTAERTWETKAMVIAAEPGQEFSFSIAGGWVVWSYLLEADGGDPARTRLTETWHFTEQGLAGFAERYGDDAPAQIENRTQAAHTGIPQTLAAIKAAAEKG